MSDLTRTEISELEIFLKRPQGKVLNFTNESLQQFFFESVKLDIYSEKYGQGTGSQIDRVMCFIKVESNFVVVQLWKNLIDYYTSQHNMKEITINGWEEILHRAVCRGILSRIEGSANLEDIDALVNVEGGFEVLVGSIRDAISKNEPAIAMDRLHTYMVKFGRFMCERNSLEYKEAEPLHNLFGRYFNHLRRTGIVESEMTVQICKSATQALDAFNKVRNEHSLAHANEVLNKAESVLILKYVTALVEFIQSIESE